jgi:hypothetical protein
LKSAYNISCLPHRQQKQTLSRDIYLDAKGNVKLWHLYLGYPGPISLYYLGINALGVKLQGPKIIEY